ncbi:MAG: twin transmembrane helix small protein [Sphingomonadaceae bacterium]|nr:twin transmembrane helix small protein [Sphingomonadaceae bacterium]
MQQTILIVLMIAAALATLGVLARGIIIMARGNDIGGIKSNRMMSYRVAFQALTILIIAVIFLLNRH